MKTITTLFVLLIIFSLNTFAQDIPYTVLEGHPSTVYSVAYSPDGQTLASGSWRTIYFWDANTGELLRTLRGHTGAAYSVAYSPDGQTLASSGYDPLNRLRDDPIYFWDANTGEHLRTLEGHRDVRSVAYSPDGQTLASSSARTIYFWDANTGEHLRTLEGHRDVRSVAYSPDGQTLASSSSARTIYFWDANTGEHLRTLEGHRGVYSVVYSVAFSPDGQTLAGRGMDTIYLWDVNTGEHLRTLEGPRRAVYSVKVGPAGRTLGGAVYGVAFSPDGQTLASRGVDTIDLWDVNTGELLRTLRHWDVYSVAFSPDGQTLASGGRETTIRLWKFSSTRVSITPNPVVSPGIGEQLTVNIGIVAGENVGGYQVSLEFNANANVLRYVEGANGDYLPPGAFFVPPVVSESEVPWVKKKIVTLGATSLTGVSNGDGTLATITFEVLDVKESFIDLFNVILTDDEGEHLLHFSPRRTKVEAFTVVTSSSAIVSLAPTSVLSPTIGEQFTFNVDIAGGQNVAASQLTYDFDESALKYISTSRGDYLAGGVGNGDGTLETVTFEVLSVKKASTVSVSGYLVAPNGVRSIPTFESAEVIVPLTGDVNRDGSVNILDLVLVASSFGQSVPEEGNPADVNEDGIVNIVDLVKVAGALGGEAAAPSAWNLDLEDTFTREQVQQWLFEAQQLNLTDATSQRGHLFLQNLLAALTPKETALLPNYPNPFNPETWIPYQLAEPADVTVTIYAVDGAVVRTLKLGHQPIGIYQGKGRAAYWDGRNALGEPVASGVYFYTLSTESTRDSVTAGEFTATRKMLIKK
ncbi:hypothetical protein C6499_21765 [Candidatus Poribacteria bacterium]|nr:MAG: hypothetical protein C6499_21765 [Candidatus Poribacteria bacterium]